jgi:hypothetical protein
MNASIIAYPSTETKGRLMIAVDQVAPPLVNNGFNQYPIDMIHVGLDTAQLPVKDSVDWVDFGKDVYKDGTSGNYGGWVSVQFADKTVLLHGGYDPNKQVLNLS